MPNLKGEMPRLLIAALMLCIFQSVRADCISCAGGLSYCYDSSSCVGFLPPQCPELLDINMQLYTRQNPADGQGQIITKDSIPSFFNCARLTIFIIHGYLLNENATWMHDTKDSFLEQGDYNVIIVGWSVGADNPNYLQSASDTRTAGAYVGQVNMKIITECSSSRALQYCVGHSLGAHICGFAGKQGQFGRITALDPAGPGFVQSNGTCGVNQSSADFVDAIHTNTILWGNPNILGHVDFFPNGGKTQPGCLILSPDTINSILNALTSGVTESLVVNQGTSLLGCDHLRAFYYFQESINTACFLSRYSCSNQALLPATCNLTPLSVLQSQGFNSNSYPAKGVFYLTTNSAPPFCQN